MNREQLTVIRNQIIELGKDVNRDSKFELKIYDMLFNSMLYAELLMTAKEYDEQLKNRSK